MQVSRTLKEAVHQCAVCGAEHQLDLGETGRDAPCSRCGCLLWSARVQADTVRNRLAVAFGVPAEVMSHDTPIKEVTDDSLSRIELVMELEDELVSQGVDSRLSDEEAQAIATVGDALRLLMDRRRAAGLD